MADFCKCGSIILDGKCTNKNCTSISLKSRKPEGTKKPKKGRRNSKCITYSIEEYEKMKEEEDG